MMEEELAALKRTLISLVVSSPTTMTVNSLVKDYRNMVGGAPPVAKFGYRDYISFLKERCLDIFVVEGPTWDPILTPKVTKNLKHIDQMVQKQKVQPSTKYKGKRRSVSVAPNPPQPRNLIAETFNKQNVQPTPNSDMKPSLYHKTTPVYKTEPKVTPNKDSNQVIETNHNGYKHEDTSNNEDKENIDNSFERPSSALSKFYKKRLPQYNSDMEFPNYNADQSSKGSNLSGAHSATSQSSTTKLEDMKNEIVELIRDSDEGVWFTDLMRLYKERYGRELNPSRFGLSSLGNLVSSMQERVAVSRPDPLGDYLLQEPSAGAPAAAGAWRGPPRRAARASLASLARDRAADAGDALPGIEIEADVYPPDCLHFVECVPAGGAGELAGGALLEVLLGEVYSPSHFWMLRAGPAHNLAMEVVMDEMNEYYRPGGPGAARLLVPGAVRVGQYCAALFERDWHRALIVQLVDSDTVKVRHVDYGTVDAVDTRALRYLRRAWAALPAQAVRARLAACRPSARGERWPRAACAAFLHAVRDRRLYANVVAVDREEDIVETYLTDTSGAEDLCLTRELIRLGHADRRQDSALTKDESYLYPRFEALESGATPNYAEICRMLADGIALDCVQAYRRHVPAPAGHAHARPGTDPNPLHLTAEASNSQYQPTEASNTHYQPTEASNTHYQPTEASNTHYQSTEELNSQYQPTEALNSQYQPTEASNSQYQTTQPSVPRSQTPQSQLHQYQQFLRSQYNATRSSFSQYHPTYSEVQSTPLQPQSMQASLLQSESVHSPLIQSQLIHPPFEHSPSRHTSVVQSQLLINSPYVQSKSELSQSVHNSCSQSAQPRLPLQRMHSSFLQSQLLHPPYTPAQTTQPTFTNFPVTQTSPRPPLLPTSISMQVPIISTQPTRPPLVPTSLPVRPPLVPTSLPVRPPLLPTPPPVRSPLLPSPARTPAPHFLQPTPPPAQPISSSTPLPVRSYLSPTQRAKPHLTPSQPTEPTPSPAPSSEQPSLFPKPPPPQPSPSPKPPSAQPSLSQREPAPPSLSPIQPHAQPAAARPPGLAPPEVRLTAAEWAVLSHLRATDPAAADWFLVVTAWRAIAPSPPHPPPPGY